MRLKRVLLCGLLPLIVIMAQFCVNQWPTYLLNVVGSKNGTVYASVRRDGIVAEIWRWTNDLTDRELLANSVHEAGYLDLADNDNVLVVSAYDKVFGIDTRNRKRLWSFDLSKNWMWARTLEDDRSVMLTHMYGGTHDLTVLDSRSGETIAYYDDASRPRNVFRTLFDSVHLLIEYADGSVAVLKWLDSGLHNIDDLDEVGRVQRNMNAGVGSGECTVFNFAPITRSSIGQSQEIVLVSDHSGYGDRLQIIDQMSGEILHRHQVGFSSTTISALRIAVSLLSAFWLLMFVSVRTQSQHSSRVWIDILAMVVFLTVPFVAGLGDLVPDRMVRSQSMRFLGVFASVITCIGFNLFLEVRRPLYWWGLLFFGGFLTFLLPAILAAQLVRKLGFYSMFARNIQAVPPQRNFRFALSDVMLAMAVFAIVLGVGSTMPELVVWGLAYAAILLAGTVLSLHRTVAWLTVAVGTFVVCLLAVGTDRFQAHSLVMTHVVMTILIFSFLRLYGFAFFRMPAVKTDLISDVDSVRTIQMS